MSGSFIFSAEWKTLPMPLAGMKLAGLSSLGTAMDLTSTFFLFSDNNRIPPGNADCLLGALKFLRDELMN